MFMFRRCLLAQAIVLASSSVLCAQANPPRSRPVDLIVQVFYEGEQLPSGIRLTVQLMDGFGTSLDEKNTEEGRVQFRTVTGIHRLRIIGPEIEEYNEELQIDISEVRRLENVRVRRKAAAALPSAGGPSISVTRLKIPSNARKEFQKGAQALERKDWQEARKRFVTATSLYPDYDLAYNGIGVAAMNAGDAEGARRAFEKALLLSENFAEANRNLARILLAEQKNSEALPLLKRSLSTEPENAWALTHAAYVELMLHDFGNALLDARKAHTVPHDGFANVHIVAAMALEATGKPAEAVQEYRMYLQEDPTGRDAARAQKAIERLSGMPPN